MTPPPLGTFPKNSSDFVAGSFPKQKSVTQCCAFTTLRRWRNTTTLYLNYIYCCICWPFCGKKEATKFSITVSLLEEETHISIWRMIENIRSWTIKAWNRDHNMYLDTGGRTLSWGIGTGAGNFASRIKYPPFATWVIWTSIYGIADRLSILSFVVVSALVFQNYLQSRKLKKGWLHSTYWVLLPSFSVLRRTCRVISAPFRLRQRGRNRKGSFLYNKSSEMEAALPYKLFSLLTSTLHGLHFWYGLHSWHGLHCWVNSVDTFYTILLFTA